MIDQTVTIPHATAVLVYKALLSNVEHAILTEDVANIDAREGGEFSTFGGYATGKIIKLTPNQTIVQTWRASNWPAGHYSTICFELKDTEDGVQIHFSQRDLPKGAQAEFEAGWQDFYWKPLTDYFAS